MSSVHDYLNKKNKYCFDSSWNIDAPLELIWDALIDFKKWPAWCEALERIEQLDQSDHLQKGNNIRSTWKGQLPYTISFDSKINNYNRYSFLSFNVTGDLHGEGLCRFLPFTDHARRNTCLHFSWNVSPTKLWMKLSSPFVRPVFMENHHRIIDKSIVAFIQMIEHEKLKKHNQDDTGIVAAECEHKKML